MVTPGYEDSCTSDIFKSTPGKRPQHPGITSISTCNHPRSRQSRSSNQDRQKAEDSFQAVPNADFSTVLSGFVNIVSNQISAFDDSDILTTITSVVQLLHHVATW